MRIAGILTGAALAVALLIVTIGIPDFVSEPERMTTEPIILPLNRGVAEPVAAAQNADPAQAGYAQSAPAGTDAPALADAELSPAPADVPAADASIADELPAEIAAGTDDSEMPGAAAGTAQEIEAERERWYAFWSPFRSELAADGFVSQLQSVTGLDYRVVKIKTGVYEVAFAYEDDADIEANLAQISAATGLKLPGG